jgi:hypothetical protein
MESAGLADICMPFKNNVRLVLADGLYGNINGNGSSPHAFRTLGGQNGAHPSSTLYFSRDMVALDSIMYDDLLDEAVQQGSPKYNYSYEYLRYAADDNHQLGTYEMRNITGNTGYDLIDFVSINRNNA